MKNLLNSTEIATLFLDKDLHIRRYTNQATKIFKLIKSDIGRSFTDLVSVLDYSELADDAAEVLGTLVFIQKKVLTKDGRWFSIRIMPYRTVDDRIDGLVITFLDLSEVKKIEFKLHETEQMNRSLLHSSPFATVKLSSDGKIGEFNAAAEKFFGKKRSEMMNQNFTTALVPEKSRKKTERVLQNLPENMSERKIKLQVIANNGKIEATEWSVSVLLDYLKLPVGFLLTKHHEP
jgi:two-component system CheB/CheR fusion protein